MYESTGVSLFGDSSVWRPYSISCSKKACCEFEGRTVCTDLVQREEKEKDWR